MRRADPEPLSRIGNCAACGRHSLLYKVPVLYRYRCLECYEREVGYKPPAYIAHTEGEHDE